MVPLDAPSSAELVEAARLWSGRGQSAAPRRDEGRVVKQFGSDKGGILLSQLRSLEDDFYRSDAHVVAKSISDMATRSADDFRRVHPEAPSEIVEILVWCYTFDYK